MNFKQYEYVNHQVSSEMFYSLMAILHERLPCAHSFFRLKRRYRDSHFADTGASSPVRMIATPKMIRGLSITKNQRRESVPGSYSPVRASAPNIRDMKKQELAKLKNQQHSRYTSHSPAKNGKVAEKQKMTINVRDSDAFAKAQMAAAEQQAIRDGSQSPHKMVLRNKFRFYEEAKQSESTTDLDKKLVRNFSPITSKKTLGIRLDLGNTDRSKTSFNMDAQAIFA